MHVDLSSEQRRRVTEVLQQALARPAPEREAHVRTRCGDDSAVLEELLGLLREARERAAGGDQPVAPTPVPVPGRIGRFAITELIASGGMGSVYLAVQDKPHRTVAVKVLRQGLVSPSALRRFELESQTLARLRHPNVAQVFDAGTHDAGGAAVPYFAMEYVPEARPITDFAREKNLGTRERLELFAKVCDAVHHGHQKGIIHRDLKPGNILVDSSGEPKVIDFGVARSTDSDVAVTTMQTDVGQLIGTLQYMSPEQCAADPADIDTRSDVYALGVVLYELLCGRVPYDVGRLPIAEAARVIRHDPPAKPSAVDRALRGDIETITLKALEKDRDRRYRSAEALADDLRRYLRHEPIQARPPSLPYQLSRFTRRHKALVAAAALVFLALTLGIIGTSLALVRAVRAEGLAGERLQAARDAEALAGERLEASRRAEQLAQDRLDEVERVAAFQAAQLSEIDAELMAVRLRDDLRAAVRAAMQRSGMDPGEVETGIERFDELLAGANLTDVALATLERNIFGRALHAIDEQFAGDEVLRARLLQTMATTLMELGLFEASLVPHTQALEFRRRALGDDDPDTLFTINSVGFLLIAQGKLGEAEPYVREALEGRRRVLGEHHHDTLVAMQNMGGLLREQGKLAEAEPYYRAALDGFRHVSGDAHHDTLVAIANMGVLLRHQGKLEEAEPFYREALDRYRALFGDDHRDTLTSINNLGVLLRFQGQIVEAEPYYRAALEGRRRTLGDDHADTLSSFNNLGFLLRTQGKLADAEPLYRQAFDGFRRVLGERHGNTLVTANNLTFLLNALQRYTETEEILRPRMANYDRVFGEQHWRNAEARSLLGDARAGQGAYEEAEALLVAAHTELEALVPPARRAQTLEPSIERLIRLYETWQRPEQAAEWRSKLGDPAPADA